MTADEIRAEVRENVHKFSPVKFSPVGYGENAFLFLLYGMASEIAAQLAELNETLRKGDHALRMGEYAIETSEIER